MTYITIKADQAKAEEIKDFYQAKEVNNAKNPYHLFQVRKNGVDISCYRKKDDLYTITFSGKKERAIEEVSFFTKTYTIKEVEPMMKQDREPYFQGWEDLSDQIGSDETGKGEFFGPLVVCATYVRPDDIPLLEKLGVNDSKKMKDHHIQSIGPLLRKRILNYVVLVSPEKLSSSYDKNSMNTEKMLSICHNAAQVGLKRKYALPDHIICYIDQFIPETRYRNYVKDTCISNPLYFRTEGETYYPSVACASVIARYILLEEWKKMDEHFKTHIPIGSGANVDLVFSQLKKKFGDEVDHYVKRYFKNFQK